MGIPTNQQRIEHLKQKFAQLEERMIMNHTILETKHSDMEKSLTLFLENQLKMQETLNQLLNRNALPQNSHYPIPSQNEPKNLSPIFKVPNIPSDDHKPYTNQRSQNLVFSNLDPPIQQPNQIPLMIISLHNSETPSIVTEYPPNSQPQSQTDSKNQLKISKGNCRRSKAKKRRTTPTPVPTDLVKRWEKRVIINRKMRRWRIRKKIRKKEGSYTWLAAARVAVARGFGSYGVDGKRRVGNGSNTWWGKTRMGWDSGIVAGGGLRGNILGFMEQDKKRREERAWTMDYEARDQWTLSGGRSKVGRDGEAIGGVRMAFGMDLGFLGTWVLKGKEWGKAQVAGKFKWLAGVRCESRNLVGGSWTAFEVLERVKCQLGKEKGNLGFLEFKEKDGEIKKRGCQLCIKEADVINDVSHDPSILDKQGLVAIFPFIISSPVFYVKRENFSPLQILSTPILNFDPFNFQVQTPIIPNSANGGKFFLNRLSSFSLLTVEGQANFYPP